jgi:hypothetical protein
MTLAIRVRSATQDHKRQSPAAGKASVIVEQDRGGAARRAGVEGAFDAGGSPAVLHFVELVLQRLYLTRQFLNRLVARQDPPAVIPGTTGPDGVKHRQQKAYQRPAKCLGVRNWCSSRKGSV